VLVLIGVLGAVSGGPLFGGPGPAGADPPANTGTVKVDGVEFDGHRDNGPHVGCIFRVDWSGFEEGANLFAHVDHLLEVAP
jgi:hypothetical protein